MDRNSATGPGAGDAAATWDLVRDRLRASVPDSTFRMWLDPLRAAGSRGDTLYLSAPKGIRTWVERRYIGLINQALAGAATSLSRVSFSTDETGSEGGATSAKDGALNPQYTFDRFVIGEGNRLAHAAALAVAEAPAEAYNPLFIHGPPGLGKTHLLVAIANYLRSNADGLSIRYVTAEHFTAEFVGALRTTGAEEFKRRHRELDVLLVDDVQFLEGKRHTEDEFFHTFNALYESGSQIVLSADRLPSELSSLAERLRDRFEWGLTVPIAAPNLATRLTVLRRLVSEAGIEVADNDALATLAGRIDMNLRQLHGALTRVVAHASLMARPISSDLISEVIPAAAHPPVSITEKVQEAVSAEYGFDREVLIGAGRSASVVQARQVAVFLTRELSTLSLPEIGRGFGDRDHSTILHSIRRVEKLVGDDPVIAGRVESLRQDLHSQVGGQS